VKFKVGDRVVVVKEPKFSVVGPEMYWRGTVIEIIDNPHIYAFPVIVNMSENRQGDHTLDTVGYRENELIHERVYDSKLYKLLK
jgi:ribosomal protein L21E